MRQRWRGRRRDRGHAVADVDEGPRNDTGRADHIAPRAKLGRAMLVGSVRHETGNLPWLVWLFGRTGATDVAGPAIWLVTR